MEIQGADAYDRYCARQQEMMEDFTDEEEVTCGTCKYCAVCPWDEKAGFCIEVGEYVHTYDVDRPKECFE